MAKFKVGDKVIAKKNAPYYVTTDGWRGTITHINPSGEIWVNGKNLLGTMGACVDPKYFDLDTSNNQKIVITTDGKTTTAKLYDGKNVIKIAEANCCPTAKFDFNLGATIALSRLTGFEKKIEKSEADEKPSFKIGDKVKITGNTNAHGFKIGSVVTIKGKHLSGNVWRCKGIDKCNCNSSWWVIESDMVKVEGLDWEAFKAGKIAVKVTKDNFKVFVAMAKMQGLRFKPDANFNPFEDVADIFFRVTLPVTLKRDELYIKYKDSRLKAAYDCDDMEEFVWQ